MGEQEPNPEPSYAYLLHNNEERVCEEDIDYCTWDENGKPIPFCFQYPHDKKCLYNTQSPDTLFMGCYDDPICGGKPLGKTIVSSKDPPFAYTIDGKCVRSGELCDWITDKIVVPKCAQDTAKCRDTTNLIGCYTEKTCGGNAIINPEAQPAKTDNINPAPAHKDSVSEKKKTSGKVSTTTILLLVFIPLSVMLALIVSYYVRKKYKNKRSPRKQQVSFAQGQKLPKK